MDTKNYFPGNNFFLYIVEKIHKNRKILYNKARKRGSVLNEI